MSNFPPRSFRVLDKKSKFYRILSSLVRGEAISLNNTGKQAPDHSLHCTLMSIERMGIELERGSQIILSLDGKQRRTIRRYWLDDYNLLKAQSIMGMSR